MTAFHFPICALDRCYTRFDEQRHLNQAQRFFALNPRTAAAGVAARRRKQHIRAPSNSLISTARRRRYHGHPSRHSLSKIAKRPLAMASQKEFRHAPSAEDSVSADCLVDAPLPTAPIIRHLHDATTTQTAPPTDNSNDTNQAFTQMESREMAHETAPIPVPSGHARSSRKVNQSKHGSGLSDTTPMMAAADSPDSSDLEKVTESIVVLEDPGANTMRPPPTPIDTAAAPSALERQSSTAASSLTSRATNRLSLTLPIAQPNSDASRPTPITIASTPSSVPPTPLDSSAVPLPSNVNEFIIAIAAKERKVLELKEELAREEAEIAYLKRQLSSTDALSNRGPAQYFESASNAATPASDGDLLSPRRSADLERRFHFSQNQGTPTQTKRRVLCGGHTRTLSLLSPARTKSEFSLSGDQSAQDQCRSPAADRRAGHPASARLPQRASWQPRSHQNSPVVPQLVEDLKVGFRAFVEDIRQITIGDEPINGMNPQRNGNGSHRRAGSLSQGASTDLEPRIRPSQTQQKGRLTEASAERPKLARTKHFSWTPLGFESLDDTDWTSWQGAQSPVPARSTRWSGSTINSGIADDIQIIPESADESTTPGRKKRTRDTSILSPLSPKLEELLPNVVNRLTPSNLQRTANSLMEEWEKSLMEPSAAEAAANKENTA